MRTTLYVAGFTPRTRARDLGYEFERQVVKLLKRHIATDNGHSMSTSHDMDPTQSPFQLTCHAQSSVIHSFRTIVHLYAQIVYVTQRHHTKYLYMDV
jgi:hypothetical protein